MKYEEALPLICKKIETAIELSGEFKDYLSADIIEEAAEEMLLIWEKEAEVANSPQRVGVILPFNYVIPDQDLKLVETTFSVLTATAGASYFLPELGLDSMKALVAAITGVAVAVLRLLHNLRLSVHLEDRDFAIVALLAKRRPDGLSTKALLEQLKPAIPKMGARELNRRLAALTSCASVDGSETALVWQDKCRAWRVNGI